MPLYIVQIQPVVHSPGSNIFSVNLNADQYGEFNLSGFRAMFRVGGFFSFAMFAVLFSPYFPLIFLQPSLHMTLKHFGKFRTRLQRSKVLWLSACFRFADGDNCTPPSSLKVSS